MARGRFGGRGGGRRKPDKPPVEVHDVYCKHETEKALLVAVAGFDDMWIPKSQIDDASEVKDDTTNSEGTLVVSHWIATEKGLVDDDDPDAASAFDNTGGF